MAKLGGLAALALLAVCVAGCNGWIMRTHAKPPGLRYQHPLFQKACRLQVVPLESTSPARSQVVLIATVSDNEGKPVRNQRVEWLLEGAGNIIEVDESGYLPSRGYKVDNRYAVSHTDWFEHRIKRTSNAEDDFVIKPGQSWCVITSSVEGDTQVTAYCPDIADWNANRVVAAHHWIDAGFSLPPAMSVRCGTQAILTTNLFRHSDKRPLAGYQVRYKVLDGPQALLVPGKTDENLVASDINGNATVGLAQLQPQAGRNRVAIEIIRAPDPSLPSGVALPIARGETTVDWGAGSISVVPAAPTAIPVGQDAPVAYTVSNTGTVEARSVTVRAQIPEGAQYVRSNPAASVEGNLLVWTLAGLAPRESRRLEAVFRTAKEGTLTSRARVDTNDGLRDEKPVTIQVLPPATPQLKLTQTGPPQAVIVPTEGAAGAGSQPVTFLLTVTNAGTGPATNALLRAEFDSLLAHESGANPLELPLGTLAAGETRNLTLTLRTLKAGTAGLRVRASADGGLNDRGESKVEIREAKLAVAVKNNGTRFVGKPVVFDVEVANLGQVPLGDVAVRDLLPPELGLTSAVPAVAMPAGTREVVWSVGTLQPGQRAQLQLTAAASQPTARAVNVVQALGYPVVGGEGKPVSLPSPIQSQAETALALQGLPASLRMTVTDTEDPLEVGGRTTYQIDVSNPGAAPAEQVAVSGVLPPQVRLVTVRGPVEYRVDGNRITFAPLSALGGGQAVRFAIDVEAIQAGDARFRAELTGGPIREPLVKEESTNIR